MPRPVGLEAGLIGLEPLPRDVGRPAVPDQHQALLGATNPLTGVRPPRLLTPRVDRSVPVAIGPGVGWVVKQVLQRRPIGPPPLQLPPVRPALGPDRDADLVMDQIPQ